MARTASGVEHIEAARKLLKSARTADDLRLAQSVLLPLELGLSIEQTAIAIGRSSGATCTMRTRFGKVAAGEMLAPRSKRELRNRANTTACTACWRVTGGAISPPTPIIRRMTPKPGKTGKKTPQRFGRNREELCQTQAYAPDVPGRSQVRADQRHGLLLGIAGHVASCERWSSQSQDGIGY